MSTLLDRLDLLVPVLLDVARDRPRGEPPVALAIRDIDDDGGDLLFRQLDWGPPSVRLLELEPDPDWDAVGLLSSGRAFSTDPDAPPADPTPVYGVTLVDRLGDTYGAVRGDGVELDTPPSEGLVVDALFRLVDLATPPPPSDSGPFWTALWLSQVLERARQGHVTWRVAARLHPTASASPYAIAAVHAKTVDHLGWARMLEVAREHGAPAFELTTEAAARLDEGSFARWMLQCLPPVDGLLAELEQRVSPSVMRKIRATLAGGA